MPRILPLLFCLFPLSGVASPAATLYLDRDGTPVVRYSLSGATSEGRFVDTRPEVHATGRQKFWTYDKACFEIDARRMRRLAATCGPAEVRLGWDEQIRDRMYPGVMRLQNGGVLVFTQYLQPFTNDGQLIDWVVEAPKGGVVAFRGEKSTTSIILGERQFNQDGRGYAYLGPDEFVETKVGRVLVDHGVPQRVSEEVMRLGPLLLEVLGKRLGSAPSERPSLFLTWVDRQGSQRQTQADVVPGAVVRFGMSGSWWGSGDEAALQQIRKLLAHELVHFWNAEVFKPISWSASWVPEGNAELLALSALVAIAEMTHEQAAQQVSAAINDCIFLARGRSWSELYHYEKHAGRGPYVCGLAFQFAAVAAAAKVDLKMDAFEFWKRTWAETPRYYEAVLQSHFIRTQQPAVAASFGTLFTDKSAPLAPTLRKMLAGAGLDVAAKGDPVASAVALRGPFMTALMSADCQGNFSFSTLEDRFEIVQGAEILCKAFRKGQVIRVVEEERVFEETVKAIASANAACKSRGSVRLKVDDGSEITAPCPPLPFADPESLIQLAPEAVRRVLVK